MLSAIIDDFYALLMQEKLVLHLIQNAQRKQYKDLLNS